MRLLKILIISSDNPFSSRLSSFLEEIGYQPLIVEGNDHNIVELAELHQPALICVDIATTTEVEATTAQSLPLLFIANPEEQPHINLSDAVQETNILLRPLKRQATKNVIETAIRAFQTQHMQVQTQNAFTTKDEIFVKKKGVLYRIPIQEILFVKADDNYVIIHTPQEKFVSHNKFSEMVKMLRQNFFVKVHRSYLVNLKRASRFNFKQNEIQLGVYSVPISRRMKTMLKNKLTRS